MKTQILIGAVTLLASSLLAADAKDEIKAAAKQLADSSGYAWKATTEAGSSSRFRPGPVEGMAAKDGLVCLKMTFGENTMEAFVKGDKGAIKTEDGWQSLAEATAAGGGGGGGQPNRGRYMGRMLQNYKAPAAQAAELAEQAKDLKMEGDTCTGALTEEGVKTLMAFGRRAGGNAPEISDAKGTVKFWVKEGVLTKYEYHVQGKVSFNNNDMDIDRTTTVEMKDIGKAKIEVPEEARKKLS